MKTWKNRFQKVLAILLAICLVTGCMGASKVQAATSKSGTTYYYTWLHRQKGGFDFFRSHRTKIAILRLFLVDLPEKSYLCNLGKLKQLSS